MRKKYLTPELIVERMDMILMQQSSKSIREVQPDDPDGPGGQVGDDGDEDEQPDPLAKDDDGWQTWDE